MARVNNDKDAATSEKYTTDVVANTQQGQRPRKSVVPANVILDPSCRVKVQHGISQFVIGGERDARSAAMEGHNATDAGVSDVVASLDEIEEFDEDNDDDGDRVGAPARFIEDDVIEDDDGREDSTQDEVDAIESASSASEPSSPRLTLITDTPVAIADADPIVHCLSSPETTQAPRNVTVQSNKHSAKVLQMLLTPDSQTFKPLELADDPVNSPSSESSAAEEIDFGADGWRLDGNKAESRKGSTSSLRRRRDANDDIDDGAMSASSTASRKRKRTAAAAGTSLLKLWNTPQQKQVDDTIVPAPVEEVSSTEEAPPNTMVAITGQSRHVVLKLGAQALQHLQSQSSQSSQFFAASSEPSSPQDHSSQNSAAAKKVVVLKIGKQACHRLQDKKAITSEAIARPPSPSSESQRRTLRARAFGSLRYDAPQFLTSDEATERDKERAPKRPSLSTKNKKTASRARVTLSDSAVSTMTLHATLPTPPKSSLSDDGMVDIPDKSDEEYGEEYGEDCELQHLVVHDLDDAPAPPAKPIHPFFTRKKTAENIVDLDDVLLITSAPPTTDFEMKITQSLVKKDESGVNSIIHPFFLVKQNGPKEFDNDSIPSDSDGFPTIDFSSSRPGSQNQTVQFEEPLPLPWPTSWNRNVNPEAFKFPTGDLSSVRKREVPIFHPDESSFHVEKFLTLNDTTPINVPSSARFMSYKAMHAVSERVINTSSHPYLRYLDSIFLSSDAPASDCKLWSSKYAPVKSDQVAVSNDSAILLRKWLKMRMDNAADYALQEAKVRESEEQQQSRPNRRKNNTDDLDGFICYSEGNEDDQVEALKPEYVSSDDEDYDGFSNFNGQQGSQTADSQVDDGGAVSETSYQRRRHRRSGRQAAVSAASRPSRQSRLRPKASRPNARSNVIILHGGPSSFKSAALYASAAELGYFVFEINTGQRRSGKDIWDRVGEMSRSHLVHASTTDTQEFKQQSFLLVEDVDVIFEEDKGFWSAMVKFIETSKRPVVLTCSNLQSVPSEVLDLATPNNVLEMKRTSTEMLARMAWMIAFAEGCEIIDGVEGMRDIVEAVDGDLRAVLAMLQTCCVCGNVGRDRSTQSAFVSLSEEEDDDIIVDEERTASEGRMVCENSAVWNILPFLRNTTRASKKNADSDEVQVLFPEDRKYDMEVLAAAMDLYSCADVWKRAAHIAFEVPVVCCAILYCAIDTVLTLVRHMTLARFRPRTSWRPRSCNHPHPSHLPPQRYRLLKLPPPLLQSQPSAPASTTSLCLARFRIQKSSVQAHGLCLSLRRMLMSRHLEARFLLRMAWIPLVRCRAGSIFCNIACMGYHVCILQFFICVLGFHA
ncbi:uncharacterized protein V1518DRAFT_209451 [Limtongia smithiae]|uniref:uncharacterized protein n=1 Tax=Limtongia smithiae TaxID=1125753 RepID=UPI0034CE9EFB